jgi:ppGpp synthetase/RelA/SpoT-type nucleotidyltranferase
VIIPPAVKQKHDFVQPYVDGVASRVRDLVAHFCEDEGYAYVSRIKDAASLAEKIETGRFRRWRELDDLFACSIVIPTLSDEPGVLAFLRSNFEEVAFRARAATRKDPTVFRFDTSRFIGMLRTSPSIEADSALRSISFEVQIRTAFEHAWSVTTHALTYKATRIDWRGLRLAAQLRSATEQLDQIIAGFEQNVAFISEQQWPEVQARQHIEERLKARVDAGAIPTEAVPESWGRFCENLHQLILAHTNERVPDQVGVVQTAIQHLETEIGEIEPASFPRSISLLQFCLGALSKRGFLTQPLTRYTPLMTKELLDVYPQSKVLGIGFDLEV